MKNLNSDSNVIFFNKIFFVIKRAIFVLLLVYFGLGVTLFVFQAGYIYYPNKTDFQDCPSFKNAERVLFGSSRGYLMRRSSEKVIVFYHGNAGRACDRDYLDPSFSEQNYSTLFVEYSGYAENTDNPSMKKLLKNVEDTIDFLKTQSFRDVVVIGESVGVGPASYHALHSNVRKLILITAYNNLASVAFAHYPVYPMRLLLLNNFTPDTWLTHYTGEVSIILAENDEVIPKELGQKLYDDIPSSFKKIYILKNAGHNTIYEKEEFYTLLKTELK